MVLDFPQNLVHLSAARVLIGIFKMAASSKSIELISKSLLGAPTLLFCSPSTTLPGEWLLLTDVIK